MSKRPSLAANLRAVAAESAPPPILPQPPARERQEAPSESPATTTATPNERSRGYFAATRAGKKKATATLSAAAHRQLKFLAVEQENGTVERLLTEAINDLFKKYGKPPIA